MFRNRFLVVAVMICWALFFGWGMMSDAEGNVDSNTNNSQNITPSVSGGTTGFTPRIGEILEYDVWAKSICAGKQTFKILAQDTFKDHKVLKIWNELKTIGLVWRFTKYSVKEDLIVDQNGLYPLSIRLENRQGKAISVENTEFDYTKAISLRTLSIDGVTKESMEQQIPGLVQDSVSLQLYLRKGIFQKGLNKLYFYEKGTIEAKEYEVVEVNQELKLLVGNYSGYYKIDYDKGKIIILLAKDTYIPLVINVMSPYIGKIEARLTRIK